jgi:hypothetical protein
LLALALALFFIVPASAGVQKQWDDFVTGIDANGNQVTTKVFGYYTNIEGGQVFVVCDPDTGSETGYAYIPGAKIGEVKENKIKEYNKELFEDWDKVKKVDSVQVRLIAPNIFNTMQDNIASGPVSWPGDTEKYLVPGSDPDYWLIVAEAYNPNPWPVKAQIFSRLSRWYKDGPPIELSQEISLAANEIKYILVNRDRLAGYDMIAEDTDWNGYLKTWAEAYYYSQVTENLDQELPDSLKPNKGFISFTQYAGSPPKPNDLSDGFTISYSVDCREDQSSWEFKMGVVSLTRDGWVANPGEGSVNPDVAKQKVTQFFSSRTVEQIPNVNPDDSSQVIDGIRFRRCEPTGATISEGAYRNWHLSSGPAIANYTELDTRDGHGKIVSENRSSVPVLKYYPIFVEFYRFLPNADGAGRLSKEVTPGYAVRYSSVKKPQFLVADSFKNYTSEYVRYKDGKSWVTYWKINVNHHVTVQAANHDNNVIVSFSDVSLALPNIYNAVGSIDGYLEDRLRADVSVLKPNYKDRNFDPAFISPGNVSLGPGQSTTLYDGDVTTEIRIEDPAVSWDDTDVYIDQSDIDAAMVNIRPYFNWNGEAAFVNGWNNITFSPDLDQTEQVLSLNVGQFKYEGGDKWWYKEIAVIDKDNAPMLLQPLPYFGGGGFSMQTTDEIWKDLLILRKLSAGVTEGDTFWPYMRYNSKYKYWELKQ